MKYSQYAYKLLVTSAIMLSLTPVVSHALPTGGTVSSGTASISNTAIQTTVNQSSSKAVINWTGFNTTTGQTVQFNDPNASAITLNRVSGAATSFQGALNSNGNVWIINPNGVLIGSTGKVNTSGFLATTSNITDSNFMAGKYNFTSGGGAANATVSNAGNITVAKAGLVALVAPNIVNSGTITANAGKITLASGDMYAVDLAGDGLINIAASKAMTMQSLANSGTLNAAGGSVVITAAQASNLLDNAINLDGVINANNLSVSNQSGDLEYGAQFAKSAGGTVSLGAYRNITVDANTNIAPASGKLNVTLDANDTNAGSGNIYLESGANINSNGGNIVLGGTSNPTTGNAVGNTVKATDAWGNSFVRSDGVFIDSATLEAAGGNITIHGLGAAADPSVTVSEGIDIRNLVSQAPSLSTTGAGTITLNGTGQNTSTSAGYDGNSEGVYLDAAAISSQAGAIRINGYAGNATTGTGVEMDVATVSTTSGPVFINGYGGNLSIGDSEGVYLNTGSILTGSGSITVTGMAGAGLQNTGVVLYDQKVSSGYGKIAINGSATVNTIGSDIGVDIDYGSVISSTGTGLGASTIAINGMGNGIGVVGGYDTISTVDGNVNIIGTSASLPVALQNTQLISTGTGTFTITQN